MSEMFGTFALSVGAAVSPKSFQLLSSLNAQACLNHLEFLEIRLAWSSGQDGLIKLFGTLLYGICMRLIT